ncbi:MAG TPA: hypothetical protein VNF29_10915 [Candidatus Binataceae bacterium]|nr:hypothetical protein [Candidatus Binataceae bacterium]
MNREQPTGGRRRGAIPDKPATIEELAALHASPNYRLAIERVRATEERTRQHGRRDMRATLEHVLERVLSGKIGGGPDRG